MLLVLVSAVPGAENGHGRLTSGCEVWCLIDGSGPHSYRILCALEKINHALLGTSCATPNAC